MFQLQAQKSKKARWGGAIADIRTSCDDQWLPTLAQSNQWRPWPWKDTPGTLMNILFRSSSGTSPKMPTFREQIKPLRMKDPALILSRVLSLIITSLCLSLPHSQVYSLPGACPGLSPSPSPCVYILAFFLLHSKGPSFASVTCFLSPHSPAGSRFLRLTDTSVTFWITGGKHKAGRPNPALHLVLSGPAPCFYPAAALSSRLTVKE